MRLTTAHEFARQLLAGPDLPLVMESDPEATPDGFASPELSAEDAYGHPEIGAGRGSVPVICIRPHWDAVLLREQPWT